MHIRQLFSTLAPGYIFSTPPVGYPDSPTSTTTVESTVTITTIPPVTSMPSFTSIVTSALTTVTLLTTAPVSALPQDPEVSAFARPIEGLPSCVQDIIFTRLADSTCNPANYPCICQELVRLQVGPAILEDCTDSDMDAFDLFTANLCPPQNQVSVSTITSTVVGTTTIPTTITSTTTRATPLSSSVSTVVETSVVESTSVETMTPSPTPEMESSVAPVYPNVTMSMSHMTEMPEETHAAPSVSTSEILIPTTDAAGKPSTLTSEMVVLVAPTAKPDAPTEFQGGAAGFGAVSLGLVVGAVGVMGLVFAEL